MAGLTRREKGTVAMQMQRHAQYRIHNKSFVILSLTLQREESLFACTGQLPRGLDTHVVSLQHSKAQACSGTESMPLGPMSDLLVRPSSDSPAWTRLIRSSGSKPTPIGLSRHCEPSVNALTSSFVLKLSSFVSKLFSSGSLY
jgi:hypothetical protein